jgi:hypothetical protein
MSTIIPRHLEISIGTLFTVYNTPYSGCGIVFGTNAEHLDEIMPSICRAKLECGWLDGFYRMSNGRRVYRPLLWMKGRQDQIMTLLARMSGNPTYRASIPGYLISSSDSSYRIFRPGMKVPIERGQGLTVDAVELAYAKLTASKRRFALHCAYRSSPNGNMRRAGLRDEAILESDAWGGPTLVATVESCTKETSAIELGWV